MQVHVCSASAKLLKRRINRGIIVVVCQAMLTVLGTELEIETQDWYGNCTTSRSGFLGLLTIFFGSRGAEKGCICRYRLPCLSKRFKVVGKCNAATRPRRVSYRCELIDGGKVHLNFRVHFIQSLQPASRCHQGHHLEHGEQGVEER